ncbi:MAG: hypothetical protein QM796_12840 [Chthoniobacteraceae bacterium]
MSLAEIEALVEALPVDQQLELLTFLENRVGKSEEKGTVLPPLQRVSNLHAGAWQVADDFDAELPDEFWSGREA